MREYRIRCETARRLQASSGADIRCWQEPNAMKNACTDSWSTLRSTSRRSPNHPYVVIASDAIRHGSAPECKRCVVFDGLKGEGRTGQWLSCPGIGGDVQM